MDRSEPSLLGFLPYHFSFKTIIKTKRFLPYMPCLLECHKLKTTRNPLRATCIFLKRFTLLQTAPEALRNINMNCSLTYETVGTKRKLFKITTRLAARFAVSGGSPSTRCFSTFSYLFVQGSFTPMSASIASLPLMFIWTTTTRGGVSSSFGEWPYVEVEPKRHR